MDVARIIGKPESLHALVQRFRGTVVPGNSDPDRNVAVSGVAQELRRHPRPVFRVAGGSENQFQVKFRAVQQLPQCPGVVDVIPDVGIQNDRYSTIHGRSPFLSFLPIL